MERVANESFMKGVSKINALKLRVGYGETSNQAVNLLFHAASFLEHNNSPTILVLPHYATGYYVSQLPNPILSWGVFRRPPELRFVDFYSILNNRLCLVQSSGIITITKTTRSAAECNAAPDVGRRELYGQMWVTRRTKGISEFSASGNHPENPKRCWTWDMGVNMSFDRNKVTQLASGVQADMTNWWFVGHPINVDLPIIRK